MAAEPILADVEILNVPGGDSGFSDSTVNLAEDCNAVAVFAMAREGSGSAELASFTVNGTAGTVIDNTLSPSRTSARIGAAYATGFATGAGVTVSGTWTEANNDYIVVIIPIRGADESDPLGLFQVYAPIGTAVSPSDTFTPGTGGSLILFGLVQTGGDGSPYTLTSAGWAKLADAETGTSEFGDIDALAAYKTGDDPAALETFTATPTSAGGIAGIWVEIKSGAGGEPTPETYTYAGSGGADFGGTASLARTKAAAATGGASFGGTAPRSRTKAHLATGGIQVSGTAVTSVNDGPTEYIYTPTGGMLYAGAAPFSKTKAFAPSGGIQFAGAVPAPVRTKAYQPTGGLIFDGDAPLVRTKVYTPEGGMSFGGIAVTDGPGEKDIRGRSRQLVGIGHLMNS